MVWRKRWGKSCSPESRSGSEKDYCGILKDILDLQQAKELSEDILRDPSKAHGKIAGYIWQR